jgi:hypothetical protein
MKKEFADIKYELLEPHRKKFSKHLRQYRSIPTASLDTLWKHCKCYIYKMLQADKRVFDAENPTEIEPNQQSYNQLGL